MVTANRRASTLVLALVLLGAGNSVQAQEPTEDDPVLPGCPIVARAELELTLELEGNQWVSSFNGELQSTVREVLAGKLSPAGIPDGRYLGVKSASTMLCETKTNSMPRGRRLLIPEQLPGPCLVLKFAVYIPEPRSVTVVWETVQEKKFCREVAMALDDGGDLQVTCGVEDVARMGIVDKTHQIHPWGMTAAAVFFLGIFVGTVLAAFFATIVWQCSHRMGCLSNPRKGLEGCPVCEAAAAQSGGTKQLSKSSLSMLCKRSLNGHVPLHDSESCDSIGDSVDDKSSSECVMVQELGDPAGAHEPGQVMLMSMYFEEIVTKSNAGNRKGVKTKTRILHRKLKVREADIVQDSSSMDPSFLLQLGSKYLLTINVQKEHNCEEGLPFACLDHIVVVPLEGTPQMLPLVTLSTGSPTSTRSGGLCCHKVTALWDPCQHSSQDLLKLTPDGASVPLDVTVVFRALGPNGTLCYVHKTLKVRLRDKGEVRSCDKPYARDYSAAGKIPGWAKPYAKGSTVTLQTVKQNQDSSVKGDDEVPSVGVAHLSNW